MESVERQIRQLLVYILDVDAAQIVDNRSLQAVQASGFVDAILAEYPYQPQ